MRLDIRYKMVFHYDTPVREAHNEVRVRPRDAPGQRLLAHRLTPIPTTRVLSFVDYWGTTVDHLGLLGAHDRFELIAEAAVETRPRDILPTAPLSAVSDLPFSLAHSEYLTRSAHVDWTEAITQVARDATAGCADVDEAAHAIVAAARSILTYERASTRIGIPLSELVVGGRGVCQDFAHLTLGLLRSIGMPARYVSGYLFAADETATELELAEHIVVQTHAWIEVAVPDAGWLALDPTNDRFVGEDHVIIGHGRDYDDVAPVRGVYLGEATPTVDATVEMRHMEPLDRSATERPPRRHSHRMPPIAPRPLDHPSSSHQQQ